MHIFAAAAESAQPDYVALGMVLALVLVVAVMALRKRSGKKTPVQAETVAAPVVEEAPKSPAPGSAGKLKLHDVEPKTAAMLMAITADKLGKPLNELRFISIEEVK